MKSTEFIKINNKSANAQHDTAADFGVQAAKEVIEYHETLPGYCETPLVFLPALSKKLGVGSIFVKDESKRFSQNSFKVLGGTYAVNKLLAEEKHENATFITATDGNHGRGIAFAAKMTGHKAIVYMPKGSSAERLENIRSLGAEAILTDLNYDDTVRLAVKESKKDGMLLVQDTVTDGNEETAKLIMRGYLTMGLEAARQLGKYGKVPTHIFLQAGVGAMAGAMCAFFADRYKEKKPCFVIVEPHGANCIFETLRFDDGTLHFVEEPKTVMAGLCCGEPCSVGYELIHSFADFAVSCDDETAKIGMRTLARPVSGDSPIISGESGAATLGAVFRVLTESQNREIKEAMGLDERSVILCISTEGDTDKENYERIVNNVDC